MSPAGGFGVGRLALGVILLGLAGCAGSPPPGSFERAQTAAATRVAAGIADPSELVRPSVRPLSSRPAAHQARAAANAGAVPDEHRALGPEARERRIHKVLRSVCPSCLGPEPVLVSTHMEARAAKPRQVQADSAQRGQPSDPDDIGSGAPPNPPTLTPLSAAPVLPGTGD